MPGAGQVYHKRELEKGFYYAQAVKAGHTLYVSGCVSWDAAGNIIGAGDMRAQVQAVYSDLKVACDGVGAARCPAPCAQHLGTGTRHGGLRTFTTGGTESILL